MSEGFSLQTQIFCGLALDLAKASALHISELPDPQVLHGLYFMLLIHCGNVISAAYPLPCQALNRYPPHIQVYR